MHPKKATLQFMASQNHVAFCWHVCLFRNTSTVLCCGDFANHATNGACELAASYEIAQVTQHWGETIAKMIVSPPVPTSLTVDKIAAHMALFRRRLFTTNTEDHISYHLNINIFYII